MIHNAASRNNEINFRRNRSGDATTKGKERIGTSKKETKHCSAHLNLTYNSDGTVNITGCFGHVGHEINPALLKWTTSEEEYLKGLLKEFTFDYILKKMRSENDPRLSRLYYINKSDLWNLVVKYRLRPGCRDDDMTSLRMRNEEKNEMDGIKVLNFPEDRSGKGFSAVIITPTQEKWLKEYSHRGVALDDTFNTTRYNLRLAVLMVADKKDRGLPAGVKRILPDFNPKIFLSDEAMAFFNGFKMVFPGSTALLLFCRFHILQSWMKKAKELVKSTVTCDALKKAFSQLLKIADEATFQNRLTETEYLHRNANARADYLIDMLIKSSDELAASYFIMDRRKLARPFRIRECNAAHTTAVKNYDSNEQCITRVGDSEWEVVSITTEKTFRVEMNAAPCDCDPKENIRCNACGVCSYRFTCSCAGAQKSGISCAHQHAVMMYGNVCFEDGAQRLEAERRPESEDVLDIHSNGSAKSSSHPVSEAPQTDGSENESRMAESVHSRDARIEQWRSAQISYSVTDDKIRRMVKMDTEESMEKLMAIVARIKTVEEFAVAGDEPQPSLPSRPEMTRRGAKPQLTTIRMDTRAVQRKQTAQVKKQVASIRMCPEIRSFCGICLLQDPRLPEDMDPEDYDAQTTDWLRCNHDRCRIWVHASCGRAVQGRICTACKKGQYVASLPRNE
ncbi:hypothetical protein ANCDUO_00767 [Ancylostoma duodenale]|uniref:SWIM-type domain-containing protein n=1 Tax=Ancylostoma duodenale TaxID=51022 RepID=A0A0C2E0Q9_9BILA|nr:hypothetical protein ANCDUO_00767 [Ancylostoma duodenale]